MSRTTLENILLTIVLVDELDDGVPHGSVAAHEGRLDFVRLRTPPQQITTEHRAHQENEKDGFEHGRSKLCLV